MDTEHIRLAVTIFAPGTISTAGLFGFCLLLNLIDHLRGR